MLEGRNHHYEPIQMPAMPVTDIGSLGAADIALREIIEQKIGFDLPEFVELTRPSGKNRRRPQHWTRLD